MSVRLQQSSGDFMSTVEVECRSEAEDRPGHLIRDQIRHPENR